MLPLSALVVLVAFELELKGVELVASDRRRETVLELSVGQHIQGGGGEPRGGSKGGMVGGDGCKERLATIMARAASWSCRAPVVYISWCSTGGWNEE